jgi:very-short-patch-repair endonuclease
MPAPRSTPKTMHRAGGLRKQPTPAEAKLWAYLRRGQLRDVNFRRQHAVGRYVVDFCAPRHKLIIELDGSQHLQEVDREAARTGSLEALGYRVLRFWNGQVMDDMEGVARSIVYALKLIEP